MNRIPSLPFIVPLFFVFVAFAHVACEPGTCASDSDCAADSVCLVDADGPRCTAISLPVRGAPDEAADFDVEIVDEDAAGGRDESGIVLRDASTSFAPGARAGTIVMRPITVIVTRSPSTTSTTSATRSQP